MLVNADHQMDRLSVSQQFSRGTPWGSKQFLRNMLCTNQSKESHLFERQKKLSMRYDTSYEHSHLGQDRLEQISGEKYKASPVKHVDAIYLPSCMLNDSHRGQHYHHFANGSSQPKMGCSVMNRFGRQRPMRREDPDLEEYIDRKQLRREDKSTKRYYR